MVFGILIGRDFGTALLAGSVAVFIMIAAGLRLRYWLIPLGVFILIALYIVLLDQMRLWRILSFLEPEKYAQGEGYQLNNSLMALGSGGWFGQGFAASRMKARYLPEAHTDFILSIVGEELGLFGMILVLIGYGFLAYYAVKISLNSTTRLGMLLGSGLSFVIICQALINITVISGMAPTKGMPAPFISYGGSNIMMCFIAVGLLFSIARETIKGAKNTAVPPRDEG